MPFEAPETIRQLTDSMGAMLLLHSSNQALIEVSITPSASPWYPVLDAQLGSTENLVVGWRRNGYLYFQQGILAQVVTCGQGFLQAQPQLDALFDRLRVDMAPSIRAQILQALGALDAPVSAMISSLDGYLQRLATYQQALEGPYAQMTRTVAQIQAEAADIQAQITTINTRIAALQQQILTDRQAIAKAEAARRSGIVETVFGILLAPISGGASLILAGIGVATIADAQEQLDSLQSQLAGAQSEITTDQQALTTDQQQIATLQGLTMSVSVALTDIADISTALGVLRTTWSVLQGMLSGATDDVRNATTATQALLARVWFDAACDTWREVTTFAGNLLSADAPVPTHVSIGGG